MKTLTNAILKAENIILTTHRDCDGDGLGAEVALYFALKKIKKNVKIFHVDELPERYSYLISRNLINVYNQNLPDETELALVFDTNDERLIEPLFSKIRSLCDNIFFIDHHPFLINGPIPKKSYIDMKAASTGEVVFNIIKELNIPIDSDIANALYLSIVFDTQLFRYIRASVSSHKIAIELLPHIEKPEVIHKCLFGVQTPSKIAFLSKSLSQIEYYFNNKLALGKINKSEIERFGLSAEDTRDVIDRIIDIQGVEVAVLFREDSKDNYKLSFRSKSKYDVLAISEQFGGGGHHHASGAYINGDYNKIKEEILSFLNGNL